MTETNFTPGPWHWSDHIAPFITVYAMIGDKVVPLSEAFYRDSKGVAVANANLIAAAPEMYEALKELAAVGAEAWGERPCVVYALGILAKARGERP